jgi:hypothetical protein
MSEAIKTSTATGQRSDKGTERSSPFWQMEEVL